MRMPEVAVALGLAAVLLASSLSLPETAPLAPPSPPTSLGDPSPEPTQATYCVTQGATSYDVAPVTESESAISYYDYYSVSAHTPFVEAYVSVLFLYKDATTGNTYLMFHFNIDNGGTPDAETDVTIVGIPSGAGVVFSDDPGEFSLSRTPQGQFHYFTNTDGGILGPLPTSSWTMNLTVTHFGVDPMQSQRWIDGDGTELALSLSGVVRVSNDCNEAPTASPGGPYSGDEGSPITFDAGSSTDPDGDALTYRWDFDGDGAWDTASSSDPTATHTFGDDWSGSATVEVSDGDLTDVATAAVTVANVAPTIAFTSIPAGDEGQSLAFEVQVTDPGSDDLAVVWSGGCAGWSAATLYPNDPSVVPDPDPSPDVHARDVVDAQTPVCGDDGTFDWTVKAGDDDDGVTTSAGTFLVSNLAPVLTVLPPTFLAVDEGLAWTLTATALDPGSDDLTFTWTWEFGPAESTTYYNDGVGADPDPSPSGSFPFTASDPSSHTYGDNSRYAVTLRVEDDDGGAVAVTTTFSVDNLPPTYTIEYCPWIVGCDSVRDEGGLTDYRVPAEDPGSDDLTFTWAWGDGAPDDVATHFNDGVGPDPPMSPNGTFPFSAFEVRPHAYGDNGDYLIHVDTEDDDGGATFIEAIVTILNVPPTLAVSDAQVDEAATISFVAAFSDPGFDFDPAGTREDFTAMIDWGDGSVEPVAVTEVPGSPGVPTTGSLAADHVYGDNGAFLVTIEVCDDDGGCGVATATITVFNVAPPSSIDEATQEQHRHLPAGHFYPLDPITFNGSAVDVGSDDLTFSWDFGDGTVIAGGTDFNDGVGPDPLPSPGGTFPFAAADGIEHAYALPGDYVVTLTVTDDDGGFSQATSSIHVTSALDLKTEATERIRDLKRQAIDRGDWRFVRNLDDAERFVWMSLGYADPFRPTAITAIPDVDVSVAKNAGDRIDLVLGPSWTDLGTYQSFRITWGNGVVTTVDLPDNWPTKRLRYEDALWIDAWEQDLAVESKRDKQTGQVTLKVHAHDASLGFSLSLDADPVADLAFAYEVRPWWIDGAHLDPALGANVFLCERAAVDRLVKLVVDDGDDDDDDDDDEDGDRERGGMGFLGDDDEGYGGDDDDDDGRGNCRCGGDDGDDDGDDDDEDDRDCRDEDNEDGDDDDDGGGDDDDEDGDGRRGGMGILGGDDDDDDDDDEEDEGGCDCGGGDEDDDEEDEDDDESGPRTVQCRLKTSRWTDAERAQLDAECDLIANLLVKADEMLARVALEEARETPVHDPDNQGKVDREIREAERDLSDMDRDWGMLEYEDAICDSLGAWSHAQRAVRFAGR